MSEFETRTFGDVVCILGDCLPVMDTLQAQNIGMVFADLPYGVTHHKWDCALSVEQFWQKTNRVCLSAATKIFTATQPFASALVSSNLLDFRYDLIWKKTRGAGFLNAKCRPLTAHETILLFSKVTCNPMSNKAMIYNAQKTAGKPYPIKGKENKTKGYGSKIMAGGPNATGERHPLSVLEFAHCKEKIHPTQKPVALLEWLIATYTNPGDLILDPTAGSGTTGVAALNLGRRAVLIEKDPTYFEVMCKRIAEHQQKMEAARE